MSNLVPPLTPKLAITLLGSPLVLIDDQPINSFSTAKVWALLAYLAIEGTRPLERAHLAGLLWPDRLEESARGSLRHALSNLGKAIGNQGAQVPYLLLTRRTVQLNPEALQAGVICVDALQFQALHTQAKTDLNAAFEAASLYGGPFFDAGLSVDSPEFDGWAQVQREALHRQMVDLLMSLHQQMLEAGDLAQAITYAQKLVEHEPWREEAHLQLMQTLWANGQPDVAMRQYDQCRRHLRETLDVEPSAEITELYEAIRDNRNGQTAKWGRQTKPIASHEAHADISAQQTTSPSGSEASQDVTVEDPHDAKSNKTSSTPVRHHNIPTRLKSFYGREAELAEIDQRFTNPDCRLLTVVGPGGMGKTQLALEYAQRSANNFADGAWLVSLAGLADGDQIPSTIANALDISMAGNQDPLTRLCQYFGERSLLLILDNFEHLRSSALLVPELLSSAPQLTILVTSRERLNLQAETVFALGGLDLPPLALLGEAVAGKGNGTGNGTGDELPSESSAVALFVDCAQRADLSFTLTESLMPTVAAICHLTDGMPLGIELAAVWTRLLSCQEILENLRRSIDLLTVTMPDIPARHRCMRVLFEESWQNLSVEAQQIFAQSSIFRSGCDWAALQAVTGATLLHVAELMDRGFLRREGDGSYQIHELMRQFGAEKLAQLPEAEVEVTQRHADYYLHYLQQMEVELFGNKQVSAAQTLSYAIENVRAAWQWALEQRDYDLLAKAAEGHFKYYHVRALAYDGTEIYGATAESLSTDTAPPIPLLVRIRNYLGSFLPIMGRTDECREMITLNLAVAREHNLTNAIGWALIRLGYVTAWNDAESARKMFEESRTHFEETGDTQGLIAALGNLWYFVGLHQADLQPAFKMAEEALRLSRELEAPMLIATNLARLGRTSIQQGSYDRAWAYSSEALDLVRSLKNKLLEAELLSHLGIISRNRGEFQQSLAFHEESLLCHREINLESASALMAHENLGRLAIHMEAWETALAHFQETIVKCQAANNDLLLARCQEGLALVWVKLGDLTGVRKALRSAISMNDLWESNDYRVLILETIILLLIAEENYTVATQVFAYKTHHYSPNPHSTFDESECRTTLRSVLGAAQFQTIESAAPEQDIDRFVGEILNNKS